MLIGRRRHALDTVRLYVPVTVGLPVGGRCGRNQDPGDPDTGEAQPGAGIDARDDFFRTDSHNLRSGLLAKPVRPRRGWGAKCSSSQMSEVGVPAPMMIPTRRSRGPAPRRWPEWPAAA